MARRVKVWRPVALAAAVLFVLVNVAGVPIAAARGELWHTVLHVVLLIVGAYAVRRLAPRREADGAWRWQGASSVARPDVSERLTRLESAVDAVALEVERIGEGQRFVTRLFTDQRAASNSGASAPEPGTQVGRP